MGYEDPAREGQNISFICPSGQALSGPNSSICMENGEWEPDPGEVECTGECFDLVPKQLPLATMQLWSQSIVCLRILVLGQVLITLLYNYILCKNLILADTSLLWLFLSLI